MNLAFTLKLTIAPMTFSKAGYLTPLLLPSQITKLKGQSTTISKQTFISCLSG